MLNNKANIINALMLANEKEVSEGKLWYLKARNRCKDIAKRTNTPFIKVVGMFSALSPACPIDKNFKDVENLIKDSNHKCTTYEANRDKAEKIYHLDKPSNKEILKILNGQKTTRFFLNIYSHKYKVITIDRHAISLYFGTFDHKFIQTPKRIKKIREDYKEVANEFGLRAYQLQAITWLVWKRVNNI